jgi:hypothetical protein
MDLTGFPDGPPTKIGVADRDILTAPCAVVALHAALRQREATVVGSTSTWKGGIGGLRTPIRFSDAELVPGKPSPRWRSEARAFVRDHG